MPRGFRFLLPEIGGDPDVILPLPHSYAPDRRWSLVMTVARLREGVTVAAAQDDMSALVRRMAESNPRYRTRDANVVQLRDEIDRDSRFSILVLSGATACLLIIVCLNVANLLLVRAAGRRRELAIRTALGAGRWRLTRHVIAESVALACAGGSAGLALAYWATAALTTVVPDDIVPRIADVHVDPVVFAFGLGVSLSVGAIVSIGPAWHTLRWDRRGTLNRLLADNPRASSAGRGERAMRRILVAVQVAAAVVLLVGAGLLTETYIRLTRVDLGIDPDRVLTFGLTLPPARYASPESIVALADALVTRLEALPGVREVGLTNSLPVQPQMLASMTVQAEGQPPSDRHEAVDVRTVTPGFFRAGGIRTAYGRVLTPVDATKDVVVVNRTLVRRFWPSAPFMGPEPLGRRLLVGSRWCTIVGVVDDVKYSAPDGPAEQEAYVPLSFWPVGYVSALVRSSGDPTQLADLARQVVRAIDPELPVQDVRTMGMVVSESIAAQRLRFVLAGVFAAVALALALVGLYGVIAQSVAQRAREIGIRMALGASRPRIARMVLADALAVALIGTAAGVAISMAVTRLLATFLFGVSAIHLPTYAMVAAATLMLSGAAVWAPAWSAMRSDPASILRDT
jgi:predicted permease